MKTYRSKKVKSKKKSRLYWRVKTFQRVQDKVVQTRLCGIQFQYVPCNRMPVSVVGPRLTVWARADNRSPTEYIYYRSELGTGSNRTCVKCAPYIVEKQNNFFRLYARVRQRNGYVSTDLYNRIIISDISVSPIPSVPFRIPITNRLCNGPFSRIYLTSTLRKYACLPV